jgi:hypothetical protein
MLATLVQKGQHELVVLPLVAHQSRCLLAAPIHPLRGPFGPASLSRLLRPLLASAARVRTDRSILSLDSQTNGRPPEVSSTAFRTPPPNLQPAPLMDRGLVVICPLAPRRLPLIRFLDIGSHVCSTLHSDPPSPERPCASLSLHLHQVVKRTFTFELSNMLGTQGTAPITRGRLVKLD